MKNYRYIFIVMCLFLFFLACSQVQGGKPFTQMSHAEIDKVIKSIAEKPLSVTEKMNLLSEYFLGMPYNFKCVGDGPYALYEPWPLVNFNETNCMSFCEHVLALSISDSWDHFFNNLQQIRYQDGIIGMKTRNHYTMADWLPENIWILEDVSKKVGGKYTDSVTRTISHKTFFSGKGIQNMDFVKPDRELTIEYVPLKDLGKIEDKTKAGDILALLFAKKDNIFSAHMLMVIEKDGKKIIRESSNSRMSTFDTPYQTWVENTQKKRSSRYIGVAFMRVKDELNTPKRIIQPWEIKSLK